jgi:hypothetical protein
MSRYVWVIVLLPLYFVLTGCAAILEFVTLPPDRADSSLVQVVVVAPTVPIDAAETAEVEQRSAPGAAGSAKRGR